MTRLVRLVTAVVFVAGCQAAPAVTPSPTSAPTAAPTVLGFGEQMLNPGSYVVHLNGPAAGATVPLIVVPFGEGWQNLDGWAVHKGPLSETTVAVQFWEVGQVYGEPCDWQGTLFDPGPGVDDLATALAERPLRNATQPKAVTIGGHAGKYLEWSVPADQEFTDCDTVDGDHNFESWTGRTTGNRYQQAPGQVDRLWILDVDGFRLVIDGFSMPNAPESDVADLVAAVNGITFPR